MGRGERSILRLIRGANQGHCKCFRRRSFETDSGRLVYNLRYPGQIYDSEAGLHQNYFRDYDPAVGRYIEADPVGLTGGINPYVYANLNPIQMWDPSGLAPKPGSIRRVACNSDESERCRASCAAQGKTMESCRRVEQWRIERAKRIDSDNVITVYGWKKINESCSCNEPNFCQRNPVTCVLGAIAIGVGICLAPEAAPALAIP